ncbi:hypothetical protein Adt_10677 [Abeliophyllum distichum]|uniref:Uncharacterized protein n=1 Tax=Abeliophyllum distichum TaxID=126358 RepID=A0ABD1ULN5_9LAMI
MPRVKVAAKRPRSDRPPSSSSSEEEDPHTKRIDRCPILIGKNVDLASFTYDAPSFNLENLFEGMGWVPILTLDDKVYPTLVKEFYTKMKIFSWVRSPSVTRSPLFQKPPDTINILTLKRMKIFKENGQWVAKSKGFDDESGPSTLPFEGEDMDADEDAPPPSPPRPRSHQPSSSTSGVNEDQFNLLSGRIDSLTSTVDGMQPSRE